LFVSKTVLQGQLDQARGDRSLVNHAKLSPWDACARARNRVKAGTGEYGIVVYDWVDWHGELGMIENVEELGAEL
jgi:hypothetical protein